MRKSALILLTAASSLLFLSSCGVVSDNVITDLHGNTTNKHGILIAGVVEDNKNRMQHRKATFEMVAQPGETITLGGVESIRVYGDVPELAAVESYVSPGYALAREMTQMAIFPLTGAYMFGQAMDKVGQVTAPFERTPVDPVFRPVQ